MSYQTPPVEEPSLEQILHNVEPKLKRVLWRHRIPLQDADDLLQETFLIMVSKSGSIRNPEAWLLATLANRCIIYWRKHRSRLWDLVDSTIKNGATGSHAVAGSGPMKRSTGCTQ